MERERPEQEPLTDSARLAENSRWVLREHGVDVSEPDIAEGLADIAAADPDDAVQLVMDLMGSAGLEPDEAFAEVLELGEGEVREVLPNASERIAAIVGALLHEKGIPVNGNLEAIAQRSAVGALGTATNVLVDLGAFPTTQAALKAIDPDGSLQAEIESRTA